MEKGDIDLKKFKPKILNQRVLFTGGRRDQRIREENKDRKDYDTATLVSAYMSGLKLHDLTVKKLKSFITDWNEHFQIKKFSKLKKKDLISKIKESMQNIKDQDLIHRIILTLYKPVSDDDERIYEGLIRTLEGKTRYGSFRGRMVTPENEQNLINSGVTLLKSKRARSQITDMVKNKTYNTSIPIEDPNFLKNIIAMYLDKLPLKDEYNDLVKKILILAARDA